MEAITKFSRFSKKLMEQDLENYLKIYPNFVITNYTGLSANQISEFRTEARKSDSKYFVVKNRLCKRVLENNSLEEFIGNVEGACGIAFLGGDAVELSKMLVTFSKKYSLFQVKGGRIEGQKVDEEKIKELSLLPSKPVLLAMVLNTMQAPISGFVGVLSGVTRKFLYALNAIIDKKGEGQ